MPLTLRAHEPRDFAALFRLDQACFPPGIAYSKTMLRYFLKLPSADGLVADDGGKIVGFILTEENPPLAHVITLDVAESHRRRGVGSALLSESERNLALRGCERFCWKQQPITKPALRSGSGMAIVSKQR